MNYGPGPGSILTIDKPDFAAMRAGDLLREREPDTASLRLGGVEGHEEIFSIGNAEAAVFDANHELDSAMRHPMRTGFAPFASDASTALVSKLINICSS